MKTSIVWFAAVVFASLSSVTCAQSTPSSLPIDLNGKSIEQSKKSSKDFASTVTGRVLESMHCLGDTAPQRQFLQQRLDAVSKLSSCADGAISVNQIRNCFGEADKVMKDILNREVSARVAEAQKQKKLSAMPDVSAQAAAAPVMRSR